MRTALITGITGQDGSYLAELLLSHDYKVVGTVRQAGSFKFDRISHILDRITVVPVNLLDQEQLEELLAEYKPDEVYNLAARAFGSEFFVEPVLTGEFNGIGVTRMLEAILKINPGIRFFQACSSEVFGRTPENPQTEATCFYPRNPYGVAKVYAHWITVNYRETHNLFACSGILYNHESPRRGIEFVTRKITHAAAEIKLGLAKELRLGNLDARRDWGFAGDYVQGMWLMLQHTEPGDYILATGATHSVRDLCETAFEWLGLDYQDWVVQDSDHFRPKESTQLVGNSAKAQRLLGWKPTVPFRQLIQMMVESDLKALQNPQKRTLAIE